MTNVAGLNNGSVVIRASWIMQSRKMKLVILCEIYFSWSWRVSNCNGELYIIPWTSLKLETFPLFRRTEIQVIFAVSYQETGWLKKLLTTSNILINCIYSNVHKFINYAWHPKWLYTKVSHWIIKLQSTILII